MEKKPDIQELKNRLSLELEKTKPDNNVILSLSQQIANLDVDNVRFSVDAGIINRLGTELVGKKETAVSELVKNAYDADATVVRLIFDNSDEEGGTLIIEDDGVGMSREELINGFMKISSTDKIHNPLSPKFKRHRAGRKGIGRFAVQRLAKELVILTKKEGDNIAHRLEIDWSKYKGDKNLLYITNKIEETPSEDINGTSLRLIGLRDKWTKASIERIYRYVSGLIQPFPLSKIRVLQEEERNKTSQDPGFKAEMFKKQENKVVTIADEQSMILDYAAAVFEGYVDKEGSSFVSIESKKLGISELVELGAKKDFPKSKYANLKNVHFKAHYFLYLPEFIPSQQRKKIVDLAQHSGGIRLYRNGFRVLPYGEFGDDWLELDESVKKRTFLPVHSNSNFFGFVEVIDRDGVEFEETSSREGLLETESFQELRDFLYRALTTGIVRIANEREVKVTTNQKNWERKYERPVERLKIIKDDLKKESENTKIENYSGKTKSDIAEELDKKSNKLKQVVETIDEVILQQEQENQFQLKEISILRVLASLGLSIGIYTHEVRQYLASINASVKFLSKKFPDDKSYQSKIERLRKNVEILTTYTSYFDKTVSENVTRELVPQEIPVLVTQFFKTISLDNHKNKTQIHPLKIKGSDLYTIPMHSSEWATILYNLYTNSLKAIKRAEINNGEIFIEIGSDDHMIYLEFSDNGDGIPEDNQDKIFEPFFTTSNSSGHFTDEDEELLGTGLGLKIVKDIIDAYGGNIEVVDSPKGFSTCIRIEIPEATDKDLETA
ncbi:sensor histidine kinase [Flagellimonas meridianipacifica]|uniref:histidine kinase n=1 Tax=Flagellimonas meridianipacifica TaxID=1080225 RepID=A0A2T0MIF7_9FLAO|nr:ATP-binding protein [Allomuricauda pacifica]PRX57370.1 signal transduction histidine kinase [Allomuricauda pacifica]